MWKKNEIEFKLMLFQRDMQTTWVFQVDKRADALGLLAIKVKIQQWELLLFEPKPDSRAKNVDLWHIDDITTTIIWALNGCGLHLPQYTSSWNWIKNLSDEKYSFLFIHLN